MSFAILIEQCRNAHQAWQAVIDDDDKWPDAVNAFTRAQMPDARRACGCVVMWTATTFAAEFAVCYAALHLLAAAVDLAIRR